MAQQELTERDRKLAQQCLECKICASAREKQRGLAYWIVRLVEGGICPACKAYEKVYGRRAHEPEPDKTD